MATTKRSTVIGTVVDTLTTETGWTEDFPIQGGLHIYNNELKAHIDGQIVTVYPQASGGTTEVINISSAQILAMGTTPIELLPAAGANKYYDIEKVILEFTEGNVAYTDGIVIGIDYINSYLESGVLGGGSFVNKLTPSMGWQGTGNNFAYNISLNSPVVLQKSSGTTIADGNGTLRAIVTYTLRTFGA